MFYQHKVLVHFDKAGEIQISSSRNHNDQFDYKQINFMDTKKSYDIWKDWEEKTEIRKLSLSYTILDKKEKK